MRADRRWFRDSEDKERREKELSSGLHLFDDLRAILEEEILNSRQRMEDKASLDSPNRLSLIDTELGNIAAFKKVCDILPRKD